VDGKTGCGEGGEGGEGEGSRERVEGGGGGPAGKGGGGRRAGDPTQPWRGKRGLAETLSLPPSWKFAWSTCFGGRLEGFLG